MLRKKIIIYFLVGAVLAAAIFLPGFSKLQHMRARERRVKEENERLKKLNIALKEEIKRLQEDPVYIEGVARDKMGVVREGEIVYKVLPEKR